jgi:hypothetical protein
MDVLKIEIDIDLWSELWLINCQMNDMFKHLPRYYKTIADIWEDDEDQSIAKYKLISNEKKLSRENMQLVCSPYQDGFSTMLFIHSTQGILMLRPDTNDFHYYDNTVIVEAWQVLGKKEWLKTP